jgi:hypothetical protein
MREPFRCTCWTKKCEMHPHPPTIAEIEARLNGLENMGPWAVLETKLEPNELGKQKGLSVDLQHQVVTAWVHGQAKDNLTIAGHWSGPYQEPKCFVNIHPGDAAFIANAPRDVAYLLRIARAAMAVAYTANVFCIGGDHQQGCECLADFRRAIIGMPVSKT